MRFSLVFAILASFLLISGSDAFRGGMRQCPKGWLQFQDSCYFRQPDLLNFNEARLSCRQKHADILKINDSFEMDAVKTLFPDYYITWVDAWLEEELEWLYEPYEEKINGKTSVTECIGFYASPTKKYNFWYSCLSKFHSICEKPLDSFRQWVQ